MILVDTRPDSVALVAPDDARVEVIPGPSLSYGEARATAVPRPADRLEPGGRRRHPDHVSRVPGSSKKRLEAPPESLAPGREKVEPPLAGPDQRPAAADGTPGGDSAAVLT